MQNINKRRNYKGSVVQRIIEKGKVKGLQINNFIVLVDIDCDNYFFKGIIYVVVEFQLLNMKKNLIIKE